MKEIQLPIDPFEFKSLSKANPTRIVHKIKAEILERWSRLTFAQQALPFLAPPAVSGEHLDFNQEDTAVTRTHMQLLRHCITATENLEFPAVEIGAFRGVTSATLACTTNRLYYLIDPSSDTAELTKI